MLAKDIGKIVAWLLIMLKRSLLQILSSLVEGEESSNESFFTVTPEGNLVPSKLSVSA